MCLSAGYAYLHYMWYEFYSTLLYVYMYVIYYWAALWWLQ